MMRPTHRREIPSGYRPPQHFAAANGARVYHVITADPQYPPTDLACSIISFHEQVLGCYTYINQARRAEYVVRGYGMLGQVLQDFTKALVIPSNTAAATVFEELVAQRVRVGTMDLRIAAIALSRGMVIVTRNVSDFRKVTGLQIEDWTV